MTKLRQVQMLNGRGPAQPMQSEQLYANFIYLKA